MTLNTYSVAICACCVVSAMRCCLCCCVAPAIREQTWKRNDWQLKSNSALSRRNSTLSCQMDRTSHPGSDEGAGSEGMEPSHNCSERDGRLVDAVERVELPLDEGVCSGDEWADEGGLVSMRSVELDGPIAYFPLRRRDAWRSLSVAACTVAAALRWPAAAARCTSESASPAPLSARRGEAGDTGAGDEGAEEGGCPDWDEAAGCIEPSTLEPACRPSPSCARSCSDRVGSRRS